jgi:hypothetical protein
MDDIVRQAMAKWPDVPDCYGWLGLDSRGQWWMRDDRVQALGAFQSGRTGTKGSVLQHEKLIDFIQRNYEADGEGRWYFQNGPQRVYIELEATPHIWRLSGEFEVSSHTGAVVQADTCLVDETGKVYLSTSQGLGLVHTLDVGRLADALALGLWPLHDCVSSQLPQRHGYVMSPQADRLARQRA